MDIKVDQLSWKKEFILIYLPKIVIFLGLCRSSSCMRTGDPFCLVSSTENPNFKVVIKECVFRARRVTVAPRCHDEHNQALQQMPAKYPINRIDCKVVSVPCGNMSGNQPNFTESYCYRNG